TTRQAAVPPTWQAHDAVDYPPDTVKPEIFAPAAPAAPPWPPPYFPASTAKSNRGAVIVLIVCAIALVLVVAGVVGFFVLGKLGPSQSPPTASAPPTAKPSYGTQTVLPPSSPSRSSSAPTVTTGGGGAPAGARVVIDGVDQNVGGSVVCTTSGGNV